jgi:hypothetical protein
MKVQVEFLVAVAIALFIVFAPRPIPFLTEILANPLGQIAALGGLIWVGYTQSLLVTVLLAVLFVLALPGREFADDASMKPKCKAGESYNAKSKKCEPTVPPKKKAEAPAPAPAAKSDDDSAAKPTPTPKPASEQTLETFTSGGGISYAPY